jgi:membrane protein implicated in regulation of membrane protease activity
MMQFFEQIYWFIALPASLIFIIQSVMTFAGMDAADGTDVDFDGDLSGSDTPFQLFSFRNLVNFLLGFSWGGISFYSTIEHPTLLSLVAVAIGAAFVWLFFVMMKQIQKLAEDNTFSIGDAVDQVGQVYLPIPPRKTGKGKIQVSVKGSSHELDAITEEDQKIETGSMIRVVAADNNVLTVIKL